MSASPPKNRKPPGRTPVAPTVRVRAASPDQDGGRHRDTIQLVGELADIVDSRRLTEVIVDTPDLTVTIRRGEAMTVAPTTYLAPSPPAATVEVIRPAAPAVEAPAPAAPAEAGNGEHHMVTSPFVGTFYRRPNPDADPYTDVGARVTKGQVLCIVEAMKLMNEIEADVAGTVVAILVDDSQPVEYGQALFKISPA